MRTQIARENEFGDRHLNIDRSTELFEPGLERT
jgi:hypothetical protein